MVYDIDMLATLPESEVRSGYGEVIKHAFISDRRWLNEVLRTDLSLFSTDQLIDDLSKGVRVKAKIVEKDEKEQGVRKHLNLGHTLAHAIEAELGYGKITHGEAVALGIWFALNLSNVILDSHLPVKDYVNWLKTNHYPIDQLNALDAESLLNRMKWDKKTIHEVIHYVLLKETGDPCVKSIKDQVLKEELRLFLEEVRDY
ncbi:3-dehydroquinate synthase family protein [Halobacillus salinarum]